MVWSRVVCVAAIFVMTLSCGGDKQVKAPPAPTAAPSAEPTATETETAPAPKAEVYDVDLMEDRNTPPPKMVPRVEVHGPGFDQVLPSSLIDTYVIRYKITGWEMAPEGSYLQFVLDNKPFKPITSPKEKVKLSDLNGGEPLTEGEHFLALYIARKNHEAIKVEKAIVARRFFVGKKTDGEWSHRSSPLLVLGRPHGNYSGSTEFILIDYIVVNAELGEKKHAVHLSLKGPGIKDAEEHYVKEWVPMLVVKAHEGEYELTADLVDSTLEHVDVPQNPVVRKFTVKK